MRGFGRTWAQVEAAFAAELQRASEAQPLGATRPALEDCLALAPETGEAYTRLVELYPAGPLRDDAACEALRLTGAAPAAQPTRRFGTTLALGVVAARRAGDREELARWAERARATWAASPPGRGDLPWAVRRGLARRITHLAAPVAEPLTAWVAKATAGAGPPTVAAGWDLLAGLAWALDSAEIAATVTDSARAACAAVDRSAAAERTIEGLLLLPAWLRAARVRAAVDPEYDPQPARDHAARWVTGLDPIAELVAKETRAELDQVGLPGGSPERPTAAGGSPTVPTLRQALRATARYPLPGPPTALEGWCAAAASRSVEAFAPSAGVVWRVLTRAVGDELQPVAWPLAGLLVARLGQAAEGLRRARAALWRDRWRADLEG